MAAPVHNSVAPHQHARNQRGDGRQCHECLAERELPCRAGHAHERGEVAPHPERETQEAERQQRDRCEQVELPFGEHAKHIGPEQHANDEILRTGHDHELSGDPVGRDMGGEEGESDDEEQQEA